MCEWGGLKSYSGKMNPKEFILMRMMRIFDEVIRPDYDYGDDE